MSSELTLTPKLLSSLAKSYFLMRALVLNPVSTGMDPSFTPSAKLESSSGVKSEVAMSIQVHKNKNRCVY
jgi:hypothetical protein